MARLAFLAAMMLAQPALAADWSADMDARHQADWSGVYLGAFAGLGITNGRAALGDYTGALLTLDVDNGLFPHSIKRNRVNGLVGVAAGWNFQSGSFVGGIEGDIGYSWSRAHHTFSRVDPGPIFPGVDTNTRYETDFGALGSLRLRGGYSFDNTLFYGTADIAAGHVHNRFSLALPQLGYASPDWSASGVRYGYALGAGIEHKVTSNVSLRFETIYYNLADRVINASDPTTFPGENIDYRFSNDILTPRFGLTVKF